MSKRTLMPYAAGLLLAVTLAGCAAGDGTAAPQATKPAPHPSTPSASVVPSTPTPAASTSATPDFPDGLPAAAKKRTKEGAKAFVEHFIVILNQAWRSPEPALIKQLCAETSKSCQAFIDTAEALESKGHRYDSDPVRVDRTTAFGTAGGLMRIAFVGGQTGARVIDAAGSVVDEEAISTTHNMFYLDWSPSGWRVEAIKDVK